MTESVSDMNLDSWRFTWTQSPSCDMIHIHVCSTLCKEIHDEHEHLATWVFQLSMMKWTWKFSCSCLNFFIFCKFVHFFWTFHMFMSAKIMKKTWTKRPKLQIWTLQCSCQNSIMNKNFYHEFSCLHEIKPLFMKIKSKFCIFCVWKFLFLKTIRLFEDCEAVFLV